jgi:hypothetical protein
MPLLKVRAGEKRTFEHVRRAHAHRVADARLGSLHERNEHVDVGCSQWRLPEQQRECDQAKCEERSLLITGAKLRQTPGEEAPGRLRQSAVQDQRRINQLDQRLVLPVEVPIIRRFGSRTEQGCAAPSA